MSRTPLTFLAGCIAACVLSSTAVTAQIVTFGGDGERKTSSIFFYDKGKNKLVGSFEFTYGSPTWKDAHEKVTGNMRLGKDGWSTLDNNVPLTIGGVRVPAGNWYLGLRREEDKYFLMVLKVSAMRKKMVPPWETATVQAEINAPLEHSKLDEPQQNLVISAVAGKPDPTKATFTLSFGPHKLSAAIVVHLDGKKAPAPKKKSKRDK